MSDWILIYITALGGIWGWNYINLNDLDDRFCSPALIGDTAVLCNDVN